MLVGIMTNFNKPTKLAKFTTLISKSYNIDVIYLRSKDVNIENDTVKGKMLINNKWVEKETNIPPFIDIAPYCFKRKNKEITDYLKDKTFLSDDRTNVLTKQRLQNLLKKDPEFSHLVIPTYKLTSLDEMHDSLKKYSKIVLKPIKGLRGRGIYVLEAEGEKYTLGYNKEKRVLNKEELAGFFKESIEHKGYILQQYVSSRTLQGDPFDCRIHVEKDQEGKWVSARNYIRIGIGQKVISNVNQGGGIANPEPFLKANFGEQWKEINKKLNELAVTLPYRVEQLRGTHIMSLGMDIGIGQDGKLYLFEVNDGPDTSAVIAEVAYLRSNYYKYILRNKLEIPEERKIKYKKYKAALKERNTYRKKVAAVQKERDFFKKKYAAVKKSTSWRLTAPIRIAGSIIKKLQSKK
ncbi:YheC/YheD family protein [Virgibacillus ainsalahensis]